MSINSDSELLSWLKLFWTNEETLSYDLISDGYFLNEVFKEIDPNAITNEQLAKCRSILDCFKNWEILIKNIRVYYTIELQQAFVTRLPSIISICYDQFSSTTKNEINKTIFLILGAAVQCEKKQYFIKDIIERLPDESIQHGLMGYIKQITESADTVVSSVNAEELSPRQLVTQLRVLTEQWETSSFEDSKVLLTQIDTLKRQIEDQKNQIQVLKQVGTDNGLVNYSSLSDKTIALELTECKAKLRKLQNELDEKNDVITDLREDLDGMQEENAKLKESHLKLTNDSRRLRMLQDEVDSQKELILRMPIIETENTKLKEKVNSLEFFRLRCEELREDMAVLDNENNNLRDKIENNQKIVEKAAALETENRKANRKIEELEQSLGHHLAEIQRLESRLEMMQEKDSLNSVSKYQLESQLRSLQENDSISSISNEVMEKTSSRIMKLEIENRQLKERLSENKTEESAEVNKLKETIIELEEEKERLSQKIIRLQESNKKEIQQNINLEESKQLLVREKQQLEMEMQSVQENKNRRINELIQENENLSETIMVIRERSEKSNDLRVNELEKENSKLHLSLNESNHKLAKVEFDLERMNKKCLKLDSSLEKAYQENLQLSKSSADLEKEMSNLKLFKSRLKELQDKYSNLEVEKLRLDALVSEYHLQLQKSSSASNDTLEESMKELATENQRKTSQLLQKISELESDLLKTKAEIEKEARQRKKCELKIQSLDQELENSKIELSNYSRMESKFKLTEKNMTELEKERGELQSQILKLEHEIKVLEKENRRLKNQYEVQNSSVKVYQDKINDMESKIHILELNKFEKTEFDALQVSTTEMEKRLVDSEQKNRQLIQQVKEEKKQCSTLREELLNERMTTQNLKAQNQKLTEELDKSGISEFEASEEKFKKLESNVKLTVEDIICKKEEQISLLQSKLDSSVSRNTELAMKYKEQVSKYHSLEQKYEEELSVFAIKNNGSVSEKQSTSSFTQHLLDLKDDLIKKERQNAQLDAEKSHLTKQCQELKDKLTSTETKSIQQLENLQKKYNDLNNTNMKLEIEKSTLKSQLESLRTENSNLSNQISSNEKNLYSAVDELSSVTKTKQQLDVQYSSLQEHYNKLSSDYEQLKEEAKRQKEINKSINTKYNTTNEQLLKYKKDAESQKHLKDLLESEKNSLADGARQLISLREENSNLITEKNDILQRKIELEADVKSTKQENKFLKSELNKEKELNFQLNDKIKLLEQEKAILDRNIAKLEAKIEHLMKENEYLKLENQKLLNQMKNMLIQNQELITESLQSRQNQHSEEVALRERLNHLQRHKERLEEKIMEQYKAMPSAKKPRGARKKFLTKAKEMLKRRDSKSSIDPDRKIDDLSENEIRFKRSQSCGALNYDIESLKARSIGDRSSDYQNDQTDTSEREAPFDSEESDQDCGAPTPKVKSSIISNTDTYSLISSSSYLEHSPYSGTPTKLIPGSMSMYDRDESERNQTKNMYNYFNKLNEEEKTQAKSKKSETQPPVMRQTLNLKNVSRTHPRPPYSEDFSSVSKQQLPPTMINVSDPTKGKVDSIVFGNISSKTTLNQSNLDTSSVSSNDTSIIVLPTKKPNKQSQPSAPPRKASLPVTDRFEEELSNVEIIHDKISDNRKLSYPVLRPQSTVPAYASSKVILQRMQRNPSRNSSSNSSSQVRGRPQTPSAEVMRISSNNNSNSNNNFDVPHHSNSVALKQRPQTSLGGQISYTPKNPIPYKRGESSYSKQASSDRNDSPEKVPAPPVRRESGAPRSNQDSGSNKSDKSDKNNTNQKIYYQYGNV